MFSNDVRRGIVGADMVFLCVETPAKKDTEGNGMELDTWPLERAVNEVAKAGKEDVVVVVKSTVPVGMAKKIAEMVSCLFSKFDAKTLIHCMQIMRARPGMSFEVVSNPEFLCEGKAVWNLQFPDRVLIGSAMTNTGQEAALALANIYASWVNPEKIQFLSNPSAELAKLASNAMLAQRISSVNAISVMCEQTGADISQVRQALGSDPRIGSSYLKAGIGFGGPCLRKDTLSLAHTAGSHGLSAISKYWMDIVQVNDYQSDRFVQQVVSRLGDSLFDKKVAIFGWAFKKRTSDSRGSRSICVLKGLLSYSLKEIAIFDPGCNPTAVQKDVTSLMQSFPGKLARLKTAVVASGNPYAAAKGANAILILTDWDVFKYYPPFGGPPSDLPRESSTDNDSVASSFTYSSKASSLPLEHDDDLIHSNPNILGRIGRSGIYIRNLWSLLKPEAPCHPKCQRCMNRKAEFKNSTKSVEWERIAKRMENPKWIFDGRNVVNVAGMERLGFRVETIGNARKGEMDWDDLDSI